MDKLLKNEASHGLTPEVSSPTAYSEAESLEAPPSGAKWDKSLFASLSVFLIVFAAIFFTNFPFNSWMTGWDNLHPEFNFAMNFSRGLTSVWQQNQGVGTFGGHGYAATLPHTVLLFIMSIILPDMYLRSAFTFLCLLTGGFGVFFLIRKILRTQNQNIKNLPALLGSLYYILNFGTVQNFYIQLESFIVHFALLPWLFLTSIIFLERPSLRSFAAFLGVSIIATIQGFIPPLFFVYMILLSIFLFFHFVSKPSMRSLKLVLIVFVSTLIVNAYWFLPVILYSVTRSATYLNSYNNLSSTDDFILKNEIYGNIQNMAILKGFISEAIDSMSNTVFPIFSQWIKHLDNFSIQISGYILFGLILLGTGVLALRKEISYRWFFLAGFLTTFSLLATDTFPLFYISRLMQHVPILKQAFRVAFTKFSISVSLFYAISIGFGLYGILLFINKLSQKILKNIITITVTAITLILLIYFSWPVFTGNFIYSRTKITVPPVYSDLFSYFKSQNKNERIANLPQGWNWGWSVYDWGYSGSGFLWYGIEQPIMDRSFDVWSRSNENYYWELNHAIFSEDFNQFDDIMQKYNISWIIVDENIIPYLNSRGYYYTGLTEKYLSSSNKYSLKKVLKSEQTGLREIKIYQVKDSQKQTSQISDIPNTGPSYNFSVYDRAFTDNKTYITTTQSPDTFYPFRNLFSNTRVSKDSLDKSGINIDYDKDTATISASFPYSASKFNLAVPLFLEEEKTLDPSVANSESRITITSKIPETSSYSSKNDKDFLSHSASNCQEKLALKPNSKYSQEKNGENIIFTSLNSENCYTISLKNLSQRYGYIIAVKSKHISGKPLQLAIINEDSKKTDLTYSLTNKTTFDTDYVFIPPMKHYGVGYSILFNNVSIGKHESINELQSIDVLPILYNFATQIRYTQGGMKNSNNILAYYTAYDSGWKAYEIKLKTQNSKLKTLITTTFPFIFGTELKNHVLVNNWANGWELNSKINSPVGGQNSNVVIVFLPQNLEYFGLALLFGLTAGTIIFATTKRHKK